MTITRVQFTKTLVDDKYRVEAEIISGPLNRNAFYFTNVGGIELGPYVGVVDVHQLINFPVWESGVTPTFGVPFVRHNKGFRFFDNESDIEQWSSVIAADIRDLALGISDYQPTVTTIDIETI